MLQKKNTKRNSNEEITREKEIRGEIRQGSRYLENEGNVRTYEKRKKTKRMSSINK